MAAAGEKQLVQTIVAHAWSPDRKQLAIAPNTSEVYIYSTPGTDVTKWEKKYILTEHEGFVSALDWSSTGKIVTCGHDRNAYVWEYEAGEDDWKPTLVILRINRAATACKWSPSGTKFAVASGAKVVPVCYYEKSNNWWISKTIKNHKSTVTSLAWAPDSCTLATGCTDFKARIHSAFIEELDVVDAALEEQFPAVKTFGEQLAEYASKGWVNAVSYSPDGLTLAYVSHGSVTSLVDIKANSVFEINQKGLPYLDMLFLDNSHIVAVGFDCNPAIYSKESGTWVFSKSLDAAEKKAATKVASAFNKWADADKRGQTFGADGESEPLTRHHNAISGVRRLDDKNLSTCGIDGRVLFWTL